MTHLSNLLKENRLCSHKNLERGLRALNLTVRWRIQQKNQRHHAKNIARSSLSALTRRNPIMQMACVRTAITPRAAPS